MEHPDVFVIGGGGTGSDVTYALAGAGLKVVMAEREGLGGGGVWTTREAIWHGEGIPGSLAIMGAGAIGVEFAQIYARFGSRVTLIEALDRCLPLEDPDSSRAIRASLEAEGIAVHT